LAILFFKRIFMQAVRRMSKTCLTVEVNSRVALVSQLRLDIISLIVETLWKEEVNIHS
jgi:hypothetical protein